MPKKKQLWSGRFSEAVDPAVKKFTSSLSFDKRLALYDIQASLAHARMLGACAILARRDVTAIQRGLARVRREIETPRFERSPDDEAVHVAIELRLTALAADAADRLHPARWPAPASPAAGSAWRAHSGSRASPRIRSTPSPTATLRSSSAPARRL